MSDQPELFGDELAGPPPAADAPAPGERHRALVDGPLRRLVDGNFIQYASYVIRDRAIPELDDGLKPVQRRILHALHQKDDGKFIKVANIVGHTMQFHPHGDAAIGDALVGLANKRFLLEGQGNFGNLLTGDPAAAPRYIECRLTELAREEIFHDELTEFVPTYDGRNEEPVVLPARVPLLLMLGADGIAVGITTRILPHNFGELLEAQIAILQDKPFELVPDFPQGGLMDASAYDEGRGPVRLRARVEIRDAQTLVIREIPWGATTDSIIASIEDAGRKGKLKLKGISDFTSERVEIEVKLQPEQDAARAVEALYAFTQCEMQVPSRIVVIRDNRPIELDVPAVLRHNTERLLELLRRDLRLRQKKLTEELHRRALVRIFIEARLYQGLEKCGSPEEAEQVVRDGLAPFRAELQRDLTRADVELLLEVPVRRIARFDLERNRAEMEARRVELAESQAELANLTGYAIRYLRRVLKKYAADFPRRTERTRFEAVELRALTATELRIGYDREKGYLGHKVGGERLLACSSLDRLLLVWRDARFKVVAPPEKLFVDTSLVYAGILDRARVLTAVYTNDPFTYVKRFTAGGTMTNREYRLGPRGSEVRVFADTEFPTLYVQYAGKTATAIRQQEFPLAPVPLRDRAARGALLSMKTLTFVGPAKPPTWDEAFPPSRGNYMDLGVAPGT